MGYLAIVESDLGPAAAAQGAGGDGGRRKPRISWLWGPAFVAAVAYVDPGNVAANLTAGSRFGYLLVWVLVLANLSATLVQYLSAKLGLVAGRSLPELLAERMPRAGRILFWVQAELVALATDVAEVIGGALALQILFGLPLLLGGVIVGAVSMLLLSVQTHRGQRPFEFVVIGLLLVIAIGFTAGLFVSDISWPGVAAGLLPHFSGVESVLLAAGMLGATVMPHAIYVHSSLARDRYHDSHLDLRRLVRATRWDVVASMAVAGTVNIAMLLLAAANLEGVSGTDSINGAHQALAHTLGPIVAALFGVGLLASGLASTAVGSYAGASITSGLLKVHVPMVVLRAVTLVPALVVLGSGVDPTWALVLSQVLLSFGIPFALIPLVWLTSQKSVMGELVNRRWLWATAAVVITAIIALNVTLIVLVI